MRENKFFICKNKKIFYKIRRNKKAKNVRISIRSTGEVLVTIPFFLSLRRGEKVLKTQKEWLYNQIPEGKDPKKIYSRERKEYLAHKEKARQFIWEKIYYFNQFYNFPLRKIFVRNQTSRWGSCSSKGNLNFNYKMINLPEKLSDYIIVHELCHLRELNHSSRFWELVSQTIPDYKERRKD